MYTGINRRKLNLTSNINVFNPYLSENLQEMDRDRILEINSFYRA